MRSRWFDIAVATIDAVLRTLPADATRRQITEAVQQAYPFGQRKRWPYKKWLEAQALCLTRLYPRLFKRRPRRMRDDVPDPRQSELFTAGGVA